MAKQTFTTGQVLTAAQLTTLQTNAWNWTVSNKTASYTLVAADAGTRIVMSSATATTITVNTSLFTAGDTLFIQNIGAGTCTITAGTASVTTASSLALAQWGGGTLYFTSASAAVFFSGGGASYGTASGTPTPSASYTDGGLSYKRIDFTASSTFVVTSAGLFDVLAMSGGGGGGSSTGVGEGGGGGAASQLITETIYFPAGTYTITIGGGGATLEGGQVSVFGGGSVVYLTTTPTNYLSLEPMGGVAGGGGWYSGLRGYHSSGASYRSGYGGSASTSAAGVGGFAGGASSGTAPSGNGGGGGAGGAGASGTAGAGRTLTFTGTSTTYCAGGAPASTTAGAANTGNGGGGSLGSAAGQSGGSGFVSIRWKV